MERQLDRFDVVRPPLALDFSPVDGGFRPFMSFL
jgi:hypothetical protein